ncbi:MAG: hypothetical protein HRF45_02025 [Fimbriimonadia bacterium]|jgi:hypothetical protein
MSCLLRNSFVGLSSLLLALASSGQSPAEVRFLDEIDSTFRYFETRWDELNGWCYETIPTIASRQAAGWASTTFPGSSVSYAHDSVDDFQYASRPSNTAWQGGEGESHWEYTLDIQQSKAILLGLAYLGFTADGLWDVTLECSEDGSTWAPVTHERFVGQADTNHYAVVRFWRSQGITGRYWRLTIDTTATPGPGVRPQIWDIALYSGTYRPLTMPSAHYAMAIAVKHLYGRATPTEIVRAQRICENLMATPPQVGITWYVTFDGSNTYEHPLFSTSIMEAVAVCYLYLPLDIVTRSKIYNQAPFIYWSGYNLNGHSEKYIWAPAIAYWLHRIRGDYWYPRHYTNALKLHLDLFDTGGIDATMTPDFKHRYEKKPDDQTVFNWGMQEYWHNLYALSFYDSMLAAGGEAFSSTQRERYQAWQQAVLGTYALCGLSNIDSVWGVARGHSCQYIEWAAKGLLGMIKGATLNRFPDDAKTARAILENYIEHRHYMDTWDGDEEDGALPIEPLETRSRSYEIISEYVNLNKLTAAGIYLSTISLALLQGVPDMPSHTETGLARWFWNRKHLLVNTDYYSSGILGSRRVGSGPAVFDYVGVHPTRIMDRFYRPLINYRGGTTQADLPGFDFRLVSGGSVLATTRSETPDVLEIVQSPWDLSDIGNYDTRPLDPRFNALVTNGVVTGGPFTSTAKVSFFRRVLRDERTISRNGTGPSSADAYMPFVLNKGMVSQVRDLSGAVLTLYDGVIARPDPIPLADVRYIHNFYPPSSTMPGTGICIIPLHGEMQDFTGAAPTITLGEFASNYSHNGTLMTQETSRNVLRVNLLQGEAVPPELRWRAFYAITDGTDEGARRAAEFYSGASWRDAFDSEGLPLVPGIERVAFNGLVLGGMLQNTPEWNSSVWSVEVVAGPHLDVTYLGPSSLRLQAQSPTVATIQRLGLAAGHAFAVRLEDRVSHDVRFAGCVPSGPTGNLVIPVTLGLGDDLLLNFVPYEEPVARDDRYFISLGSTLIVSADNGVLKNDTVMKGYGQSVELVSAPRYAAEFELHPDGSFTYRSNTLRGDSFTYRISNCGAGSNVATVSLPMINVAVPILRGR